MFMRTHGRTYSSSKLEDIEFNLEVYQFAKFSFICLFGILFPPCLICYRGVYSQSKPVELWGGVQILCRQAVPQPFGCLGNTDEDPSVPHVPKHITPPQHRYSVLRFQTDQEKS